MLAINNKTGLAGNELNKFRRKKRILELLYHHKSLTGTSLAKRLAVSYPTALALINELKEENLIVDLGTGKSRGGRKPAIFGLNYNSILIVACDLGRYQGKLAIYNANNEAIVPAVTFDAQYNDENLAEVIHAQTIELLQKHDLQKDKIFALGLAMPGLIDSRTGINYTIKNIEYQNIKERLENLFHARVYVNNDARMQAFGEYIFGKAMGHTNALIVSWNWGLGLGMILGGKLYNGSTGFAGELSHARFVDGGELCVCGKRGCLETLTSASALVNNARKGVFEGKISQLTQKFKNNEEQMEPRDVINAAKRGDEFSISLLNNLGLALGKALSVTIQLLNPDIIVIGGIISSANQYVLTPIQQSLNKYCLENISENTKIVTSDIWEQSGLLGITAFLFQELFSDINTQ